ncbi:MAG: hypothetical protein FWC32_06750 [Firmicutes bacterium]|nr:hypothetical protein [Bacillota bacterium]
MPFETFDLGKLSLLPLSQRAHDLTIDKLLQETPPSFTNPDLDAIRDAIIKARQNNAAVIFMYGAHVIRRGLGKFLIRLMEEGLVTHLATNGAGAIHDFELAMIGATCESVEKYISEGQFGLWQETGKLNEAVAKGAQAGLGFGEAVGRYICENKFPYTDTSVLAAGYRLQIPVTVHVSMGCDIVHEHPNCDGAAIGKASMTDFLIYAKSVENLENGVFLNVGSAVTGPEVYLKCLAMARNAAKQEGRQIANFTTAVFDMQPITGDISSAPSKSDPHYFFRPWKTILARTVADGGKSYYVQGDHMATLGNLAVKLLGGKYNG